jgi:putative ABC transport system ATP-binding protein
MVSRGFLILSKEILKLIRVNKSYISFNDEEILVLNHVSLELNYKTVGMVFGPKGSGKSTLLRIAGLLESPSSGTVLFTGKELTNPKPNERLNLIRNEVGFVPPHPSLLPYLTILENLMLPMIQKNKSKALEILKSLRVENVGSYPNQISAEEQQRVSIARAIVNNPQLLLFDEPTASLSSSGADEIMCLLQDLKKEFTIMVFTDDITLSEYSDKVFKLSHGVLE